MTKPAARYQEAVEKLGLMCLRYAFKMFQNDLNKTAHRYLLLAPVLKEDIGKDKIYRCLLECVDLKGDELKKRLQEIQGKTSFGRVQSYDPPDEFIPLNIG